MKNDLRETTGLTIIAAIIVVLAAIPQLGYIRLPFLPFDITLLFVPVLVGSTLYGKKGALILGLVFGLSSMAVAFFRPASPFDLTFRNPLVSVLPRVIFPMVYLFILDIAKKLDTYKLSIIVSVVILILTASFIITDMNYSFVIFSMLLFAANIGFVIYCRQHRNKKMTYILPTFISVIFHGMFVLSMIGLFYGETFISTFQNDNIVYMIAIVLVTNSSLEAVSSSLIIQAIMPSIKAYRNV